MSFAFVAAANLALGTSAEAQEKVDVEIGYMPILPVSQLFVALEDGAIESAGIEPDLVQFQNGPAMVQALLAGQLDVAYFGIGPAMVARARGADIKVVASNIVEQISIIALGELAPYFEDGDHATAFARFAEDKGRKPVISTFPVGSVPETVLQYWLREQLGANPDDIEIIFQGAAQVQQALLTGAVDGGAVLVVREGLIASNPDVVQALVAAHAAATERLKTDPEGTTEAVGKFVGGGRLDPAIVTAAIAGSSGGFVADPNFIVDGTKVMHDFQAELGTLKQPVDLEALFDTSFFDALTTQ